jgi:hypothetical protein
MREGGEGYWRMQIEKPTRDEAEKQDALWVMRRLRQPKADS